MNPRLSPRVIEMMINAGMFTGSMDPMAAIEVFTDKLIRDCINTACLAELDGKRISKTMMAMYFSKED